MQTYKRLYVLVCKGFDAVTPCTTLGLITTDHSYWHDTVINQSVCDKEYCG